MRSINALGLWIAALALVGCSQGINGQSAGQTLTANASDTNAIFGGKIATGSEAFAKHIVVLYDDNVGGLCTASILSDSLLLTAAHCVTSKPSDLVVIFGKEAALPTNARRNVVDYRISPLYPFRQNTAVNMGDIAVVRFAGGLPAGYQPVPLVTDRNAVRKDQRLLLAGFGASTIAWEQNPQNGQVRARPTGSGKLRYVTTTVVDPNYSVSEFLLENSKSEGACHGDSGGPAYVNVGGRLMVVGVTNAYIGDPRGACGGKMIYASTAYHHEWIQQTAAALMR